MSMDAYLVDYRHFCYNAVMIVQEHAIFQEPWVNAMVKTFDSSIDSIIITSLMPEEHFLYVNDAFKRKTLYSEDELLGRSPRILQGEKTDRQVLDKLKSELRLGHDFTGQNTNYRKDGSTYLVRWYIAPLKDPEGKVVAYISYQKEITQEVKDHQYAALYNTIIDKTDQEVMITDLQGTIIYVNDAFCRLSGYTRDEAIGKRPNILRSGKHSESFYTHLWETVLHHVPFHAIFINRRKDGTLFYEKKSIIPIKDDKGEPRYFASMGQDVTSLLHESLHFKEQAFKDQLTGLYNRLKYDEIIQRRLVEFSEDKRPFSLIFFDIDHFKMVNDIYGHVAGDMVLKDIARLAKSHLRKDDFLARWGGEEFVLLIDSGVEDARLLAEKLRQAIEDGLSVDGHVITASFGVTEVDAKDDLTSLFKRVDDALYNSKERGRNKVSMS